MHLPGTQIEEVCRSGRQQRTEIRESYGHWRWSEPVVVHGIGLFAPVVVAQGDVVLAHDFEHAGVVETLDLVGVGEKAIVIGSVAETGAGNEEGSVGFGSDGASGIPFIDKSVILGQGVLNGNVINRESIDSFPSNIRTPSICKVLTADETIHLWCLHFLGSRGKRAKDGVHVISSSVLGIVWLHIHSDRLGADLRRVGIR